MPLHPVSIIVGTTLAVIGGGYAFKKFVYDPHLAPFIEALLASKHQQQSIPQGQPVRVPAASTSYAESTARRDRGTELRRRRRSSDHEAWENLLHHREAQPEGPHPSTSYEPDYSMTMTGKDLPRRRASNPLISLDDPPLSPGKAGVREVVFDRPCTPRFPSPVDDLLPEPTPLVICSPSTRSEQTSPPTPARYQPAIAVEPEFTASSLLSFSPPSSPAITQATLISMSPGTADEGWNAVASHAAGEEDVASLPDSAGGWTDAEAYSPMSRTSGLPVTSLLTVIPGQGITQVDAGERRGPASIISLSESEGWSGDSDWEGRSEVGR